MKFSNVITFVILVGVLHSFSTWEYAQEAVEENPSLTQALREIGDKYDYYFTIEVSLFNGDSVHSMENVLVCPRSEWTDLKQELIRLRKSVPTFSYRFDSNNPKVIHIIDALLDVQKDYSMEKFADSLDFYGEPSDLMISAISQKGIPLQTDIAMSGNRVFYYTPMKLRSEVKNQKARDVLTDAVPLKNRGRILWIARTDLGRDKTTYVHYLR